MHSYMVKITSAAIAMALAVPAHAAGAAPAPSSTEDSDARCLVAVALLASSGDPARQQAAQAGGMLFAGKLLGRNPSINFEAAMRKAAAEIGSNVNVELKRCGGEMQVVGGALESAGTAMQKKP